MTQQARQILWQLEEDQTSIAFLIHDNDKKFSQTFETVFESANVAMIRTPFRAPNANTIAERWVRSVREECLDRLIILNASHLRAVLKEYGGYYNAHRPHQGLKSATPIPLPQPKMDGSIRCREVLGGMIHDYFREAA